MNTAAEIVDTGRPHTLKVKLTVGENAAPGVHSIRMQTDLATTNALNFAVEATEAIEEDEDNDSLEQAQPVEFPNILAGSMNRFGDADYYRFEAKAGQEWVFDTMAGALGSGLDALLEIYDEQENLISSSLEYSDKRDAQLGCRFTEDGTYYLKVTDRQLRSGGFYRIHVSNRPFITRVFPLGGQKGEQTPIAVEGFNLQGKITTMLDIPQDHQGRAQSLSYSSTTGSAINGIRLAAGDFPEIMESGEHGSLETAMKVEAPVTINGIIEKNEDAVNDDWLISPPMIATASQFLNFYARSYSDAYGLERFKVGISTGGTAPADFTIISGPSYIQAPIEWTLYSYDLSAYAGQNIRFAIQCVSDDAFYFVVDDVSVGPVPTAKEISWAFHPLRPDHHGLHLGFVVSGVLCLVLGGMGWVQEEHGAAEEADAGLFRPTVPPNRREARWLFGVSGVLGGLGLWTGASVQLLGLGLVAIGRKR
ncbi:MAG: choice-of-anchor J domain-containing protein [Bacilli bacterium]